MPGSIPNGEKAQLIRRKTACVDTELQIRYGSSLLVRNLSWLITDQSVTKPLPGRPIEEALEMNTRELLAAVADKFAGCVDAEKV